jgi:hypothetical protein
VVRTIFDSDEWRRVRVRETVSGPTNGRTTMTDPQQDDRAGGPGGERETHAEAQATETAAESADAAARSGSATAGVPDDAVSSAAAEVGADRQDTVNGSGTNADAPDSTESTDERTVTDTGDTDRWS